MHVLGHEPLRVPVDDSVEDHDDVGVHQPGADLGLTADAPTERPLQRDLAPSS